MRKKSMRFGMSSRIMSFVLLGLLVMMAAGLPASGLELPYSLGDSSYYRVENTYYLKNTSDSVSQDITLKIQLVNRHLTKNMMYSTLLSSHCRPEPEKVIQDRKGNDTVFTGWPGLIGEERAIRLV